MLYAPANFCELRTIPGSSSGELLLALELVMSIVLVTPDYAMCDISIARGGLGNSPGPVLLFNPLLLRPACLGLASYSKPPAEIVQRASSSTISHVLKS